MVYNYRLFMVILGIIYYCFAHMITYSYHRGITIHSPTISGGHVGATRGPRGPRAVHSLLLRCFEYNSTARSWRGPER
jgi:hypothetical protein